MRENEIASGLMKNPKPQFFPKEKKNVETNSLKKNKRVFWLWLVCQGLYFGLVRPKCGLKKNFVSHPLIFFCFCFSEETKLNKYIKFPELYKYYVWPVKKNL